MKFRIDVYDVLEVVSSDYNVSITKHIKDHSGERTENVITMSHTNALLLGQLLVNYAEEAGNKL
jgi:hypothetical protein